LKLIVIDRDTNKVVDDPEILLKAAGLESSRGKYEDIGIQSDGQPVVFDKNGVFGYLDINNFRIILDLDNN